MVVQWLRLHASTEGGIGLIPSQGNKISYAAQPKKKKKYGVLEPIRVLLYLFIYFNILTMWPLGSPTRD